MKWINYFEVGRIKMMEITGFKWNQLNCNENNWIEMKRIILQMKIAEIIGDIRIEMKTNWSKHNKWIKMKLSELKWKQSIEHPWTNDNAGFHFVSNLFIIVRKWNEKWSYGMDMWHRMIFVLKLNWLIRPNEKDHVPNDYFLF